MGFLLRSCKDFWLKIETDIFDSHYYDNVVWLSAKIRTLTQSNIQIWDRANGLQKVVGLLCCMNAGTIKILDKVILKQLQEFTRIWSRYGYGIQIFSKMCKSSYLRCTNMEIDTSTDMIQVWTLFCCVHATCRRVRRLEREMDVESKVEIVNMAQIQIQLFNCCLINQYLFEKQRRSFTTLSYLYQEICSLYKSNNSMTSPFSTV